MLERLYAKIPHPTSSHCWDSRTAPTSFQEPSLLGDWASGLLPSYLAFLPSPALDTVTGSYQPFACWSCLQHVTDSLLAFLTWNCGAESSPGSCTIFRRTNTSASWFLHSKPGLLSPKAVAARQCLHNPNCDIYFHMDISRSFVCLVGFGFLFVHLFLKQNLIQLRLALNYLLILL